MSLNKNKFNTTVPLSFPEFVRQQQEVNEPDVNNKQYAQYLRDWSKAKSMSSAESAKFIRDQYFQLIKDISLNYTTAAEKTFLSKVNFTEDNIFDIVLPFYTRKLQEIILFYRSLRETVKFAHVKRQIKTSTLSVERAVFEAIVNYFTVTDDFITPFTSNTLETLKNQLFINVEQFIDTYGEYFNNEQTTSVSSIAITSTLLDDLTTEERSVFVDDIAKLREIPLIVNVITNLVPLCEPTSPFEEIINERKLGLNDADVKKFYEAFVGTDYFAVSLQNGEVNVEKVLEGKRKSKNKLNITAINSALTPKNEKRTLRDIGILTEPNKQGSLFFHLDQTTNRFSNLQEGEVYVFPDPSQYTNSNAPIVWSTDISYHKKNISTGAAVNDPFAFYTTQQFFGYLSREQKADFITRLNKNNENNFNRFVNEGIITNYSVDVYGNEFGILKDQYGTDFLTPTTSTAQLVKELQLTGGTFFDKETNYNLPSTAFQMLSTGFINSNETFLLYFRLFAPYIEFSTPQSMQQLTFNVNDNGFFTFADGAVISDSSSDDPVLPQPAYYNNLLEGGIESLDPTIARPVALNTADLTLTVNNFLSSGEALVVDGGQMIEYDDSTYNYIDNFPFINETSAPSTFSTLLSATTVQNEFKDLQQMVGSSFVRLVNTSEIVSLSSAFSDVLQKYPTQIVETTFNNLKHLHVYYDTIVLKSPTTLLIDSYTYSNTIDKTFNKANYIETSGGDFGAAISNTILHNTDIYFGVVQIHENQQVVSNEKLVGLSPFEVSIYKYNLHTKQKELVLTIQNTIETIGIVSVSKQLVLSIDEINNTLHAVALFYDLCGAPVVYNAEINLYTNDANKHSVYHSNSIIVDNINTPEHFIYYGTN